jgi:small-conductance mechanosensitive channel
MIIYSRAFRIGDYVRVGETEGVVTSIGFFTTKIRTTKHELVSIPNSIVLAAETKNYTLSSGPQGMILHTSVTIGYGTPWRQVHAMLVLAAGRTPGLGKEPPPFVNQTALSDFYVEYQINAYLDRPEDRIRTLSLLHANIQDVFNEHSVQILSPHYEDDPRAPVFVAPERWHEPPASTPEELP